jgi:hypothetical protein
MISLMKELVGVSDGYHSGYHGFQGEFEQGKPKGTLALPFGNLPLPLFRSPSPLGGPLPFGSLHLLGGPPPPFQRSVPPSWWCSNPMKRTTTISYKYPTPKIIES